MGVLDHGQSGLVAQQEAEDQLRSPLGHRRLLDRRRRGRRRQVEPEDRAEQRSEVAEGAHGSGTHGPQEGRRQRRERDDASRDVAGDVEPGPRQVVQEPAHQRRLAQAGLPHDLDHGTGTGAVPVQGRKEKGLLGGSAHEPGQRCRRALTGRRQGPERPGGHNLSTPLDLQLLRRTGQMVRTETFDHLVTGQRLTPIGVSGKPRCGDGGQPSHREGASPTGTDGADEGGAAMHADGDIVRDLAVQDPPGGRGQALLVVVVLDGHPGCQHDRGPVDGHVRLDPAHVVQLSGFADDTRSRHEQRTPVSIGQRIERRGP